MDPKMKERAQDLKTDMVYRWKHGEEVEVSEQDIEVMSWLLDQVDRAETYGFGLMEIIKNGSEEDKKMAESALMEVEQQLRWRNERRK